MVARSPKRRRVAEPLLIALIDVEIAPADEAIEEDEDGDEDEENPIPMTVEDC